MMTTAGSSPENAPVSADFEKSPVLPDLAPLAAWFAENKRDLPFRHTKDPYAIWVSEVMLQQTRVETVIPYYNRFLSVLPDISALAAAPEALLLKLWEGLGYYSRVRNMQKAAVEITRQYGGVFPQTFPEIRGLCGIGDYTAGAIASIAFDLPYPAVDGNVLRVTARLCDYRKDCLSPLGKKELTAAVAAAVPKEHPGDFNQSLIELGALICLPGTALRCDRCPLVDRCLGKSVGSAPDLPVRKKQKEKKVRYRGVFLLRIGDRTVLRRRPGKGLLSGLYEPFCTEELPHDPAAFLAGIGLSPLRVAPLGKARHIFTHLIWEMEGYEAELPESDENRLPKDCFLVPRAEIDRHYALPSAFDAYRPFF